MKAKEIKIGGVYVAKISSKLTTVRVDEIRTTSYNPVRIHYDVTNLATGRRTTFRSASKFRHPTETVAQRVRRDTKALFAPAAKVESMPAGDCHATGGA